MRPRSPVISGVGLAVSGLAGIGELLGERGDGTPFDPAAQPLRRGMRHKDHASRLALWAAERALRDAALTEPARPAALSSAGVVVASNFGNLDTVCDFTDTIHRETAARLSPMQVPHISSNATGCWVAQEHGMRGPNITVCNGTPSGLDAVFWARNLVAGGRAEVVLVLGVEPHTAPVARLHRESGGERWLDGAVGLVVESAAHADRRGAAPRALIGGYRREADRKCAAERVRAAEPHPVGLWLAEASDEEPAIDLSARLGRCSGALGVLQCAAAVASFDRGGTSALAVAGADSSAQDAEGDPSGAAALLLTRPPHPSAAEGA